MPQEAPLHLLGRNHPLVKEAERIPFKQPDFEDPFSIYYNSEDLAGNDWKWVLKIGLLEGYPFRLFHQGMITT